MINFIKTTQVCLSISFILFATALVSPQIVRAEGLNEVAMNARQKERIVTYLKDRIARHQKLSLAAIITELDQGARTRIAALKKDGSDTSAIEKFVSDETDKLKSINDKDLILAMERMHLQETMASENILFFATRANYELHIEGDCSSISYFNDNEQHRACHTKPKPIAFFFIAVLSIPLDIALLPLTFLFSAFTGF